MVFGRDRSALIFIAYSTVAMSFIRNILQSAISMKEMDSLLLFLENL